MRNASSRCGSSDQRLELRAESSGWKLTTSGFRGERARVVRCQLLGSRRLEIPGGLDALTGGDATCVESAPLGFGRLARLIKYR